jgi:peptidoglycan/xylan/chitin deacetylase (PgdA/CDA1 family)
VLTYHAIDGGPPPLSVAPRLFARHLDLILESGARALTVHALAAELHQGGPREPAVVITFDDGIESVVSTAAPLLAERGLPATVFCVAGHLGGTSDWASRADGTPTFALAGAGEMAALAGDGWEIGSHGVSHDALSGASLSHELVESKRILEEATGSKVESFAFPYGVCPPGASAGLEAAGYAAACTVRLALAVPGSDPLALPRVDAHYVRRPRVLRAILAGRGGSYLRARGVGGRVRRLVRSDYEGAGSR